MKHKHLFFLIAILAFVGMVNAQVIFYQSFGSHATGTNPNVLDADGITYTRSQTTVALSQNSPSNGYEGATGQANALLYATNGSLTISGISTLGYDDVTLSFGHWISAAAGGTRVEYSVDGTNWVNLNFARTGTAWTLFTLDGIPSVANLILRFTYTGGATNARIDDVKLYGDSSFDYPDGVPVTVGSNTITVSGGNANNGSGSIPSIPNQNVSYTGLTFELDDTVSLYTINIQTTALWGAYHQNGSWHASENMGGLVSFDIDPSAKGLVEIAVILGDQDPTLPIELSSFTAVPNAQYFVELHWTTQSETNVACFRVYRSENMSLKDAVMFNAFIPATNTSVTQHYTFVDQEIYADGTYYYWLENVDMNGTSQFHGPVIATVIHGEPGAPAIVPTVSGIEKVYPNPFNPSTSINYMLDKDAAVSIKVYNVRGQMMSSLFEGSKEAGFHSVVWNGTTDSGTELPSGIYTVTVKIGSDIHSRRVVLSK